MTDEVGNAKRALRAELRQRRRNQGDHAREQATAGLTRHLVDLASGLSVRSVSAYLSTADEPNTRPFLNWAYDNDLRVLFPISRPDGLLDWAVGDGETETLGLFDLPEPVEIAMTPEAVTDTRLASTVSRGGAKVQTIEHLMSACAGLGIDNLAIDITADEVPILDGSAAQAGAVGITVEPAEGSEQPTSDPIAVFDLTESA